MTKRIAIKQQDTNPVPTEVMADSIVAIAEGMKKLRAGRLNDRALFLLIQHAAPTSRDYKKLTVSDIKAVFEGIESLEPVYLRKKQPAAK